jgi:NAD-dependent dihydropyrimidine dehydrogenase PreA subunit
MPPRLTIVISEDRVAHSAAQAIQKELLNGLASGPQLEVTVLPHLYDLAPDGAGMEYLRSIGGPIVVLAWLYPRAIYWILDANGVKGRMGASSFLPEEELASPPKAEKGKTEATVADRILWCIDLRGHEEVGPLLAELERIVEQVLGVSTRVAIVASGVETTTDRHTQIEESTRARWYPVVDYERCGQCMECLNFCLFGVFSVDESGMLRVEQPDACRDGCPACSRVCPMGAILFPEYNNPGIAGSPKAAASALQLQIMPFFGTADAASRATAEKQRALSEQEEGNRLTADRANPRPSPKKGDLDGLVDELDKSDL